MPVISEKNNGAINILAEAPTRQGTGKFPDLISNCEVLVFDIMGEPLSPIELDLLLLGKRTWKLSS